MKKFYLLLTLLLVAFVSRAEIVVDNLTADGLRLGLNSYGFVEGKTFTSGTVYSAVAMKSADNSSLQLTNGSKTPDGTTRYVGVFNTTTVGNARKVEVTWNKGTASGRILEIYGKATPFVSTSAYSTQKDAKPLGVITKGTTTSLDITGDYPYIAVVSKKGAQYIESLKITWETGGSAITKCATPVITLPDVDYGMAGEDVMPVAITCSTPGATIMYFTYNLDNNPTGEASAEDYQMYDPENVPTLACWGNFGVKAYATLDGSEDSDVATKKFTYHPYGRAESISDFIYQGEITEPTTYMHLVYCNLYVTAQSSNGKYTFVRDDKGDALLIYGNLGMTLTNGQAFAERSLAGQSITYNGTKEMAEPRVRKTVLETTYPEKCLPLEKTLSEITTDLQSQYVVIKGVTIDSTAKTIGVGDATLAYYLNRFGVTLPEDLTQKYDAVGVVEIYNNAPQISIVEFVLVDETPEKMYMIGYIQSIGQDWHATQGVEMAKEAAGRYSANVNLTFNDWFAVTSRIAENDDEGGWAYVNDDRYAYTSGVFGKVETDYEMTKGDVKTQVFWAGNFKVTVDYFAKTISFVPAAVNADGTPDYSTVFPEKLRIVGEIADGYWAGKSVVENHLATRGEDGYTYTFNELQFIKNGNFRFTTAWDATIWDGNDSDNKDNTNYTVNDRALKAATDAEPRINFNTVANILPFTSNDLVADVQKYSPDKDLVYANLQLIVNLKDMTVKGMMYSGVSQIKVGGATVTATNGTIRVDGGNTTSIYNIAGQAIALGSQAKEFSVARGMYIVNVDGKATKVVVR